MNYESLLLSAILHCTFLLEYINKKQKFIPILVSNFLSNICNSGGLRNDHKLINKLTDELFIRFRFLNPPFTRLFILPPTKPGIDFKRGILELKYNNLPPIHSLSNQKNVQNSCSLSDYLISRMRMNT